jgi:hypothetical protein
MEMPTKSKNPEAATLFQASPSVAFTFKLFTSVVVGRNQIVEKHRDESFGASPHVDASVFVSVP